MYLQRHRLNRYSNFFGNDLSRCGINKFIKYIKPSMLGLWNKAQYMKQISCVVNYVNQTFSLFSEVEKVRPKELIRNK